jgi:hypothetical protein
MLYIYASIATKNHPTKFQEENPIMSIEKKSLISTLKTTKKANIAGAPVVESGKEKVSNQKDLKMRATMSTRASMRNFRSIKAGR